MICMYSNDFKLFKFSKVKIFDPAHPNGQIPKPCWQSGDNVSMEANFLNNSHAASKLESKSGPELNLLDSIEENGQYGHRLLLRDEEVETMNFKVLAAVHDR